MTWDVLLGYWTCLGFVDPDMGLATMLRTAAVVNACNATVCRLIANKHQRNGNAWTIAGAIFGFWAVAGALLSIVAPARPTQPSSGASN